MVCLLNELEENQLVVRNRDRADRRRALIELSAEGEHALRSVDRALQSVEDDILSSLDGQERDSLRELLARINVGEPDWAALAADA